MTWEWQSATCLRTRRLPGPAPLKRSQPLVLDRTACRITRQFYSSHMLLQRELSQKTTACAELGAFWKMYSYSLHGTRTAHIYNAPAACSM